ncbi:hypothetical protein CDIK_1814 [Cucumispora dikerogammari]|nr:hypothetical protein CDIK_1814 [Cucumispora dikerogammari]
MSASETLNKIKEKYKNTELVPLAVINPFLNSLYQDTNINRKPRITEPMTVLELENILGYKSADNEDKSGLNEEDETFHSLEVDEPVAVKNLFKGLWEYEKRKMEIVNGLTTKLKKKDEASTKWCKILSITGGFIGLVFGWAFLEYRQIPR